MKIRTIIYRTSNESLAAVALRVIDTIEKSISAEAKQSLLFSRLMEVNNRYQSSVEPNGSKKTAEAIEAKFKERERLYTEFYDLTYGLQRSRVALQKEAAQKVFPVLNMYGKSFKQERIADQTVRYIRIIETLKGADYTAAIAALNATELFAELSEAQTMYEDLYLGRGNRLSLKVPTVEMRKEMNNALKDMVDEIEINEKKYPSEANTALKINIEQRFIEVYIPASVGKKDRQPSETETTKPSETLVS